VIVGLTHLRNPPRPIYCSFPSATPGKQQAQIGLGHRQRRPAARIVEADTASILLRQINPAGGAMVGAVAPKPRETTVSG
jgi:hypothetical protein